MFRLLLCAAGLFGAAALYAADNAGAGEGSRFYDADDGWFDVSGFLDSVYGFIPVVMPITEPAVGYGAAGALVFVDRHAPGAGQQYARPNVAAIGGFGTENESRGAFGAHLGSWMDGKLRTQLAIMDADVNLEYFGLGGDRSSASGGLGYSIAARGGIAGASYRIGPPLWIGLQYSFANTSVAFDSPNTGLPGIAPADLDSRLAALTPSVTLDMRDNFFTPTRGAYVDLSVPIFREALGGTRDFEQVVLTAIYYQPLGSTWFSAVRGGASASSDGTPFYLRPYVVLRGVQALRYQGEQTAEFEAELRWQVHPRVSLVAFGGAGIARSEIGQGDREQTVSAAGGGIRYVVARKHGMHMGIDVARGPDQTIFYVVLGNAWLKP